MVLVWPPYKNGLPLMWQDVPNGSMLDLRSHNCHSAITDINGEPCSYSVNSSIKKKMKNKTE